MKIGEKRRRELYNAIHSELVDIRIKLGLPPHEDFLLAQIEHKIWNKVEKVLNIKQLEMINEMQQNVSQKRRRENVV